MLEGLEQLARLHAVHCGRRAADRRNRPSRRRHRDLPLQRALARCPTIPAQPSGRLIFTGARAIFAGGARAMTLPWHAVADVVQQDRDVILVRHDRETFHRFRCNVFADALCAGAPGAAHCAALAAPSQESRQTRKPDLRQLPAGSTTVVSSATICLCLHPLPFGQAARHARHRSPADASIVA